jgi:hypothetical protein
MSIYENGPTLDKSAGPLNTSLNETSNTENHRQEPDLTQAEFAASITCRSLRAGELRECLRYEALRVIAVATTASAYLADEDDEGALDAFRRLWKSVKTDIAIPAAELARLGGGR